MARPDNDAGPERVRALAIFAACLTVAIFVVLLALAAQLANGAEPEPPALRPLRPLLDAVRRVKWPGPGPAPRGDGGLARGQYQIHRVYWIDAVEHVPDLGGRYEDVDRREYAECVVLAYWHRHEPAALAAGDYQVLARLHNGGPAWRRKPSTKGYWARVKAHLPDEEDRHAETEMDGTR